MLRVVTIALLFVVLGFGFPRSSVHAQDGAPAENSGTISGTVLDKSTGDPLIDAGVEVVEIKRTRRTDLDGKFRITVAPGTYTVRFFAPLYQGVRVTNVVVVAGQTATADAALVPEGDAAVEVVEVVAAADKAAEATQLVRRKKASVVSDTISAQAFKKAAASDAAQIVERVPSVTVNKEDNTVVVRGLGDRYSQALLNGSRLPSTDPNKRVVSLNLFPDDFIESINIVKGYTPDLPGDFSGGLVDIELRDYPDQLSYSFGISTSGNTNTTFQSFHSYDGGDMTYLGLGKGFRDLPNMFGDSILEPRVPSTTARQRSFAGALKNIWTPETETAPINWGANFSVGNKWDQWGFNFAGLFDSNFQNHPNEIRNTFFNRNTFEDPNPDISLRDQFVYQHSVYTARMGGLLTAGYKPDDNNKINLRALVNHQARDEVFTGSGTNESEGPSVGLDQDALTYTEENLGYGQLTGTHALPFTVLPAGTLVEWRTAWSQTTQDVPDQRFTLYYQPEDAPKRGISPKQPSLLRVFSGLDEWLTDNGVDTTVPFKTWLPFTDAWNGLPAKFKTGVAYTYRDRDFNLRRFNYRFPSGTGVQYDFSQPVETLLRTHNIGATPQFFQFQELTQLVDFFEGSHEILGAYGMIELPILPDTLRVVGGVRGEYSYLRLNTYDRQSNVRIININDLDPLPAANLIYSPTEDMNVRAGFSQNVSRPEFRELTPAQYVEPSGIRTLFGNPFLKSFDITSYDLRWEWFLSPLDLVSASFFYKELSNPIERVALSFSTIDVDSFKNAGEATVWGFEFELRRNLGSVLECLPEGRWRTMLSTQLPFFDFFTNVAYTDSEVDVGERLSRETCDAIPEPKPLECTQVVTNSKRELQGQAPFVVNAGIEYDNPAIVNAVLLYNTIGRRINTVGLNGLPDIYDERRDQLDLVASRKVELFDIPLTVKASIENLLNDRFLQTQGDETTIRYREGLTVGLSVSYSF